MAPHRCCRRRRRQRQPNTPCTRPLPPSPPGRCCSLPGCCRAASAQQLSWQTKHTAGERPPRCRRRGRLAPCSLPRLPAASVPTWSALLAQGGGDQLAAARAGAAWLPHPRRVRPSGGGGAAQPAAQHGGGQQRQRRAGPGSDQVRACCGEAQCCEMCGLPCAAAGGRGVACAAAVEAATQHSRSHKHTHARSYTHACPPLPQLRHIPGQRPGRHGGGH